MRSFLSPSDKEEVRRFFEARLLHPVRLISFTRRRSLMQRLALERPHYCEETRLVLQDLASLSDKITLSYEDVTANPVVMQTYRMRFTPGTAILNDHDVGIRHYGIPVGYELSTFLEHIAAVSNPDSGLGPQSREQVATIHWPIHIQVFGSPTCPFCPVASQLANRFAVESDYIRVDSIDVAEFPEVVQRYNVRGVPRVVINDDVSFVGATNEQHFLEQVMEAAELQRARWNNQPAPLDAV